MELTHKQEMFCLAYMETGNAAEAYRRAYNAESMSDGSIWTEASLLLDNPKVTQRLEELREPIRQRAEITLEQHLADLKRLRDKAEDSAAFGPAITAEVSRGKASGLYIERVEVKEKPRPVVVINKPDGA